MFYSQFILAKKGPLGTIWIAAHLERKLRKNQVADTDIGVSVDSILFPDAPIALRLSSHLLLGVVRIYSKKVNYLFNDCSEALIKIKHAFRSTAVDLPPEESTAPYNSITLPENFDLDNFELPDSACLDSNFVDHHVSTREQITLQDTLNDTAYPTSKFGLDERFGDEDASQIGLDLDEDLFMEKKLSPNHDEISVDLKVSRLHLGETSVPSTSMVMDVQIENAEGKDGEIPNDLSELLSNNYGKNCILNEEDLRKNLNSSSRQGYTIQTPDLNEIFQPECHKSLSPHIPFIPDENQVSYLAGPAEVPSTPGLLETVPSNYQAPGLSPQEKTETHVESIKAINETTLISTGLGLKSPTSALINPMQEPHATTYSNITTNDACFASGPDYQLNGLLGNEAGNSITADHRLDNDEAITSSYFSHEAVTTGLSLEAINSAFPSLAARFDEVITPNICADEPVTLNTSMDKTKLSESTSDEKRMQKGVSNELSKAANFIQLENGGSSASTSAVGSDILAGFYSSNLHPSFLQSDPSSFPHVAANLTSSHQLTAHFNKPVTPNVFIDNMGVSRSITYGENAQNIDANRQSKTAIQGHVEIGDSCVSSSVVGSDALSRTYGSILHPISSHSVPLDFPHEVISAASHNLVAPPDAEPIISIVSTDTMGVLETISDVRAWKSNNEPSLIANLHRTVDGDSCINTSVSGSDYSLRSCVSNLHPSFSHGAVFSHEEVKLASFPNYSTAGYETEPATPNIYMDVSGSILNVNKTHTSDSNVPSQVANPSLIEDVDCINATSVAGSDFPSRSRVSNLCISSTHLADKAMEEASKLSPIDHSRSSKTPMREEMVQRFKSSFEMQGEDFHSTNDRVISLEEQHDINYVRSKLDEQSVGIFSNAIHSDPVKFSSSSEFLVPEKMLAAAFAMETSNYQGLQATDKGMADSDVSVNRNNSFSSRKRRTMDSPGILQTTRSNKLSGASRGRNTEYIFTDDDMLATILAGRTAPSLETGSVPLNSKASSQKRPRTIHKAGMHKKRKVLVDDSMVLNADAIRQQLINTEDIRRKRKKAPCSRPEVWRICIGAMDDGLFDHSILTGVELNSLADLKYVLQKDLSSQSKDNSSRVKSSSREIGSSTVVEFFNELGNKEMDEKTSSVPKTVDGNEAPSRIPAFDTGFSRIPDFLGEMADKKVDDRTSSSVSIVVDRSECMPSLTALDMAQTHEVGVQFDLHDQLEVLPVQPKEGQFSREQEPLICEMQNDAKADVQIFSDQSINLAEGSPKDDPHHPLITPKIVSECLIQTKSACNVGAISNEENKIGLIDDTVTGMQNHVLPDSELELQLPKTNESVIIFDTSRNEDRPAINLTCVEIDNAAAYVQNHATMSGNDCMQDSNIEGGLEVGSVPVDIGATHHDSNDLQDLPTAIEDYTGSILPGLLNEDENFNEVENEEPDPENNAQPLENSGWSVRTRGVARYLKTLFDDESGQGRKSIVVNRLLAGKTRKEASRMFFETLVLKTRDYIQVEQEKPFDNILIKPRNKLLKSEF